MIALSVERKKKECLAGVSMLPNVGKKVRFGSIEPNSILPNVGKKVRFGKIETNSILPNVGNKVRFGSIEFKIFGD